jgi:hypothetical protein
MVFRMAVTVVEVFHPRKKTDRFSESCILLETGRVNLALEKFRKFQKNQVELKLIAIYQILAYADNVNLLGDNIHNIKKTQKL